MWWQQYVNGGLTSPTSYFFISTISNKDFIFWDITPSSMLKVRWRFGGTCRLPLQDRRISQARNQRESRWQVARRCLTSAFTLVSCLAYSSTQKIEATCSSETSTEFQRTTQHYVPEAVSPHNLPCANLKSYSSKDTEVARMCEVGSTLIYFNIFFFLPRCSHTWERAPISEHRADYSVS
jgi:hypothetical protein